MRNTCEIHPKGPGIAPGPFVFRSQPISYLPPRRERTGMGRHGKDDTGPVTPAAAWRAIRTGTGPGIHQAGQEPLPPPLDPGPPAEIVYAPRPLEVDWEDDQPSGGYAPGQIEDYLRHKIDEYEDTEPHPRPWRPALIFTVGILLALVVGWLWGHASGQSTTALQTDRTSKIHTVPGPTVTAPGPTVYRTRTAHSKPVPEPGPTVIHTVMATRTVQAPAAPAAKVTVPGPTVTAPGPTVTATREVETCYRVRSGVIVSEIECP